MLTSSILIEFVSNKTGYIDWKYICIFYPHHLLITKHLWVVRHGFLRQPSYISRYFELKVKPLSYEPASGGDEEQKNEGTDLL